MPQVTVKEDLTNAQAAGWIDSDGCLQLKNFGLCQKYPQILYAFAKRWGGHVRRMSNADAYTWQICEKELRDVFAADVFPFLLEKYDQGQIIINSASETAEADNIRLSSLKGHQLGRITVKEGMTLDFDAIFERG